MNRILGLALAIALAALASCGGGSTAVTASGLSPLDFDLTTDPGSVPAASGVTGWEVDLSNPKYAGAAAAAPAGETVIGALLLEPKSAPDSGFSGDITLQLHNRGVSAPVQSGKVNVSLLDNNGSGFQRAPLVIHAHGTGGSFRFHLNFLGLLLITQSQGPDFSASAFADLAETTVNTAINFSAITHNATGAVTFAWDFGDGTTGGGNPVSHSYPLIGKYTATCTVTDANGDVARAVSTEINITANPTVLSAVTVDVERTSGNTFSYNSTLTGGTPPFSYAWDFDGDGTVDATTGPNVTWNIPANLETGQLRVTDQTGATASTTFVTDNRQLTLAADVASGFAPLTVNFTLTDSDPDPAQVFSIDYGDGQSETLSGLSATHVYDTAGDYDAVATASLDISGRKYQTVSNASHCKAIVRPAPHIDSVAPLRVLNGGTLTLTGTSFFTQEAGDTLQLGGVDLPVVTWTDTQIVCTVPAAATNGNVVVTKAINGASNAVAVVVVPPSPGQPGLGQI